MTTKQDASSKVSADVLPEDVRSFIYRVTLHLQCPPTSQKTRTGLFQDAYRLYAKYNVERRRKNDP